MRYEDFVLEPCADGLEIREYHGDGLLVTLPDEVDGIPVTSIAARALCDRRFGELHLPAHVKRIGNRAFSGCTGIRELEFPESLEKLGIHAFFNCTGLEKIIYHGCPERVDDSAFLECDGIREIQWEDPKHFTGLKETLDQLTQEVRAVVATEEGPVEVVFTEFEYYVLEVTPAKQFEEVVEGCGRYYRACVRDREIDFLSYDDLLPIAALKDSPEAVVRSALCRLRSGYRLGILQREAYLNFLRGKALPACRMAVDCASVPMLRELRDHGILTDDLVADLTDYGVKTGKTEVLSYLMDLAGESEAEDDYDFSL